MIDLSFLFHHVLQENTAHHAFLSCSDRIRLQTGLGVCRFDVFLIVLPFPVPVKPRGKVCTPGKGVEIYKKNPTQTLFFPLQTVYNKEYS